MGRSSRVKLIVSEEDLISADLGLYFTAINDDIFNSMANIVGRLLDDPTNPAILAELQGVHDVLVAAVPE